MFDVGFSELMVIAVVALVVIGPERLPAVARTIGNLLGRAQRYFNNIKSEVNRELQLEELKRIQQETYERVMAMEAEVHGGLTQAENTIHEAMTPVADALAAPEKMPAPALSASATNAPAPAPSAEDPGQADLFSTPAQTLPRSSIQQEQHS